jgi:hypothetical protein
MAGTAAVPLAKPVATMHPSSNQFAKLSPQQLQQQQLNALEMISPLSLSSPSSSGSALGVEGRGFWKLKQRQAQTPEDEIKNDMMTMMIDIHNAETESDNKNSNIRDEVCQDLGDRLGL